MPHDDPAVIASGPTVPDPSTLEEARAIVAKRGISLPATARSLLGDPANETPKPGDPAFTRAEYRIIARPADSIAAASRVLHGAGYEPIVLGADIEGEAREVARDHAGLARQVIAEGRRAAIISGGELTVTLRGSGRGRSEPGIRSCLGDRSRWSRRGFGACRDTDGTDGGGGTGTDPAGALVDPTTLRRGRLQGLDAEALLAHNNSTRYLENSGRPPRSRSHPYQRQ